MPPIYLDECVDVQRADALRRRAVDVRVAADVGMRSATDEQQLVYTTENRLLLVSHNGRDFRRLHKRSLDDKLPHGGIVLLPQDSALAQLTIRVAMLLDWLSATGGHQGRLVRWGDAIRDYAGLQATRLQRGGCASGTWPDAHPSMMPSLKT